MWLMFCSNPNPIEVTFCNITANDTQVSAISLLMIYYSRNSR